MNNLYFLILLVIFFSGDNSAIENGKVTKLELSPPKNGKFYRLGENLNISCFVKNQKMTMMFGRRMGNSDIHFLTEDLVVHKKGYRVVMDLLPNEEKRYVLMMDSLRWDDNGTWRCAVTNSVRDINVRIEVIGQMRPLETELVSNGPKTEKHLANLLLGKGSRTNPFDLLRETTVRVICSSDCSSSTRQHFWQLRNIRKPQQRIAVKTQPASVTSDCTYKDGGAGLSSQSSLKVNCAAMGLSGSNEVLCRAQLSNETRSVFVLCPGGHLEWQLTNGEILGISIGVALAAMMTIGIIMSVRRLISSYRYGCGIQGIRV